MSDELVLHTNPMSRGRIARWMLEEVGAPYRTVFHAYGPEMKAPEFLALNPLGKVPAIQHGERVVSETAAICAYLADAFPEAKLAPPPAERAAYYRWLFFTVGPLEACVMDRALGHAPPEDKQATSPYGAYERVMDAVEGAVSGRAFVAADYFTAADVMLGAHLSWGMQFGTIEKRPAFEAYAGGLAERPARKRADEIDNAALQEAQSQS